METEWSSLSATLPASVLGDFGRRYVLIVRELGSLAVIGNRELIQLPNNVVLVRGAFDGRWEQSEITPGGIVTLDLEARLPTLRRTDLEFLLVEEPTILCPTSNWKVVWKYAVDR